MVTQEVGDRAEERPPELTIAAKRLERELRGEDRVIGGRRIQLRAKMTGWHGSDAHARAGVAWAWVRLQPTGVQVREADGAESFVPVEDTTAAGLQGIFFGGLLVAVVCWIVLLVGRRRHKEEAAR